MERKSNQHRHLSQRGSSLELEIRSPSRCLISHFIPTPRLVHVNRGERQYMGVGCVADLPRKVGNGRASKRIDGQIQLRQKKARLYLRLLLRLLLFLYALACRFLLQCGFDPPYPLPSAFTPFGALYKDLLGELLFSCGLLLSANLLPLFVAFSQCTHRRFEQCTVRGKELVQFARCYLCGENPALGTIVNSWKCAHMSRDLHVLPVRCANDAWIFASVISGIHRYIIPIVGYC